MLFRSRGMLENHLGFTVENLWADSHDLAKIFLPHLTSYKLAAIASALSIESTSYHRAIADAEVTATIVLKTLDIGCNANPFTMQKIYDLFHFAEENNGLTYLLQRVSTYVIANAIVGNDYSSTAPQVKKDTTAPALSFNQVEDFFKPGGLMDENSKDFQHRPQQVGMLKAKIGRAHV